MKRQNGITIENVMGMTCMEKSTLIAGLLGTRRTVSKVNIMADPDALNWVSPGELLLTTAYSFEKDDIEGQKRLIKEGAAKNLAGIGIKITPYLESLSQEVLDIANKLNFPIIDIHYATPFSDITTAVFKEIFNKQASLLERIEKVHEQLMNVALNEGSFEELTKIIYENLRNPIYISLFSLNQAHHQLGSKEDMKNCLIENVEKFYSQGSKKRYNKKFDESSVTINDRPIRRMIMPILVKDRVYGHIFAWDIDSPLGGFDLSVLESASTTIALEILKQISVREVENRYRTEFIEDLFSRDERRNEKAIERASTFKLSYDEEYISIVIQLFFQGQPVRDSIYQGTHDLSRSTERLLLELDLKGFVACKSDCIYVLLSHNKRNKDLLKTFTEKIDSLLTERLKSTEFKIGVGRPYKRLDQVYKSYIDAIRAIQTGEILKEESVVYFDELGIYKILSQEVLKDELEEFYKRTVLPLVEYDNQKSTDLVSTLESYYLYNGNLKKISSAMFTHYNTILYRIQRIQDISGMNLENHKDRLNLEVALKIKRLLKK
ncbi:PucR family transcriptional regulator [Alkaliphilus transvaalensis]|uniref:PucR family transcriptional regulator n=1 Tax=Alkaliphilus transvaalensis TaxID=114628 RepID=UPI00047DC106|nr:PucR family transcriptional regulator [Alkaliphilus transvaalensis]